jgi:hypothetical protein
MTARTDTERMLDLFLAPEPERLAERVLDAALADIAVTSQRPALRLPWRLPELRAGSRATSFAAIALVAVVGIAGLGALIANDPGFGGLPTPTPSIVPTAAPTPTPAPTGPRPLRRRDGTGLLDPGTYVLDLFPVDLAFDIPEDGATGWKVETSSQGYALVVSDTTDELRHAFNLFIVSGVYANPCNEASGVEPGEERTVQVLDVEGVSVLMEVWAPDVSDVAIGATFDEILESFHIEALP